MVFCTPFGVKIETDTIKRGSFNMNGFVHTEAGLIQEKSDISCDRHHTDSSMGSFLLTKWMATYSTMHLGQLDDHNIRLIFPSQSYQQWLPTLVSVKELEDLQSWQCDIQCHCHPKWQTIHSAKIIEQLRFDIVSPCPMEKYKKVILLKPTVSFISNK